MRTRYTIDADSGFRLVDRDGNMLGRVVSLTIDDSPLVTSEHRGEGVAVDVLPSTTAGGERKDVVPYIPERPTASQLEREATQRVWDYWIEVSGKRQTFDNKRQRIIRSALTTIKAAYGVDLSEAAEIAKRAVLGLSRSPHHNGTNEQRKQYLEIRYALKGIGDESDQERIEKAVTWAALHAPGAEKVDPERVTRWLDEVRYHLEKAAVGSQGGRERALEAYRKLRAAGFQVERLESAPWARVRR